MKFIFGAALFGAALYGCIKLGQWIAKKPDPRESQFDDGNEDDNHLHV